MTARCTQCKVVKPIDEFRRSKQSRSGFSSWCKLCHNENGRRQYHKNRDYYLGRNRERWWQKHAVQFNLWNVGGTTSGLCMEYLRALYRDPCSYCGAPAEHADHIFAARRTRDNHKDRVKPSEWDNLTAACRRCNQHKKAGSLIEFLGWPEGFLR